MMSKRAERPAKAGGVGKEVFPLGNTISSENNSHKGDQAKKSTGRMPWHREPTKDVTSCDKPRRGANIHRPADFRMGEPD